MSDIKEKLYHAALDHVPFEGMNDRALASGARDLGVSPDLVRTLFPLGGADLAAMYHRRGDALLREWLAQTPPEGRFRDKIATAVWHRLELADVELVRAGTSILSLPQNAPLGSKLVWETADAIWAGLGDRSDDVNWYSKRATLSAVFGSTVLFWLGDESEGKSATRGFLDRRIDNVMQFEKLKSTAKKIPGMGLLTKLATGWIHAPKPRNDMPGGQA